MLAHLKTGKQRAGCFYPLNIHWSPIFVLIFRLDTNTFGTVIKSIHKLDNICNNNNAWRDIVNPLTQRFQQHVASLIYNICEVAKIKTLIIMWYEFKQSKFWKVYEAGNIGQIEDEYELCEFYI